jgi:predicted unusual protein kinase regulating ubiquinone biosynthesis (AarF/ABC1/UbiB family)
MSATRPAATDVGGPGLLNEAARAAEITAAFARFGFGAVFGRDARDGEGEAAASARRLRELFESLGPAFVKIGQLLALHADQLPPAYRDELSRLLDDTAPLPFASIAEVLAAELGADWRQRFAELEEAPLASASIGQVHRATLTDGRRVAVKVQRPGARAAFELDFAVLRRVAATLRLHRLLDLEREQLDEMLDEVIAFTRAELDYRGEAAACRRFGGLRLAGVVAPEIVDELLTERVLVATFLDGVTVREVLAHRDDAAWLAARGIDPDALAPRILRSQMQQALGHGFFQADPHPANVLALPDGRLGYVDFGLVGELPEPMRRDVVDMVLCELMDDYDGLWPLLLRYACPTEATDLRRFQEDYRALSARFKASAGKGFAERSLGVFVEEEMRLFRRHRMRLAAGWATYLRNVVVYGTTLATLSPRLDFARDSLPIYWEIKLQQTLRAWREGDWWSGPLVRHGYELVRVWRSLLTLAERAAAGELATVEVEHPRLERQRNLRLRAAVWTALAVGAGGAAVALLIAGLTAPAAIAGGGAAVALFQLAPVMRRLG